MKILKGQHFICIEDVIMCDDEEVAYNKGRIYHSEIDDCITDNQKIKGHEWSESCEDKSEDYFKLVYDPSKTSTKILDMLKRIDEIKDELNNLLEATQYDSI